MTLRLLTNGKLAPEEKKICEELLVRYQNDPAALQLVRDMARQEPADRNFAALREFLKAFEPRPSQVTDDDDADDAEESFQKGMLRSPSLIVNDQFPPF